MGDINETFQQELSGENKKNYVFAMQLLMKEKCPMPDKDTMNAVFRKHLGELDNYAYDSDSAGYSVTKYKINIEDKDAYPILMLTSCIEFNEEKIDAFKRSQLWDCPDHEKILSECKYQIIANDMLGTVMEPTERAEMLMDYLEALVELFPECEAVYFQNSDKMFTAEDIRSHNIPRNDRFIHFAVNVRFFNIQGTNDMLIDSLGMNTIAMPDLQYHFHDFDPNHIVNHAYNMLSYIFDNNCPIKNGDTIDGMKDGSISMDVQWKCHFENSLIQPPREVIDICMNEFASGSREY